MVDLAAGAQIQMRACLFVLAGLCFLVSLIWIGAIAYAERVCPHEMLSACSGEHGDVWVGPLLFTIVGLPVTIVSAVILIVAIVRPLVQLLLAPKQKENVGGR